jgi:simple sugar transport system ATP-binding protein
LELKGLRGMGDRGVEAVRGLDLQVKAGEIVGVAGISGNGQRELVEILAGQRSKLSGEILLHGEAYHGTRGEIRKHHVSLLPEEPLRNACMPQMSVAENLSLRVFDEVPYATGGFLRSAPSLGRAVDLIAKFSVRPPRPEARIDQLSGGNVQRVVLARELSAEQIDLLIVTNPCFGLDIKAIDEIHRRIVEARTKGTAILLVSEDLDELLALADRIVVMNSGQLVYEAPREGLDSAEVGRWMIAHVEAHAA